MRSVSERDRLQRQLAEVRQQLEVVSHERGSLADRAAPLTDELGAPIAARSEAEAAAARVHAEGQAQQHELAEQLTRAATELVTERAARAEAESALERVREELVAGSRSPEQAARLTDELERVRAHAEALLAQGQQRAEQLSAERDELRGLVAELEREQQRALARADEAALRAREAEAELETQAGSTDQVRQNALREAERARLEAGDARAELETAHAELDALRQALAEAQTQAAEAEAQRERLTASRRPSGPVWRKRPQRKNRLGRAKPRTRRNKRSVRRDDTLRNARRGSGSFASGRPKQHAAASTRGAATGARAGKD